MLRFLHLIAIGSLIASAAYAYSVKYDSVYFAEQVAKLNSRIQKERDAIAVMRAEWQRLNRPDRLQTLAEKHLDLHPISVQQIVRIGDVPMKPTGDELGRKLELLGLIATETPSAPKTGATRSATTPAATPAGRAPLTTGSIRPAPATAPSATAPTVPPARERVQ
jgi:cell division protein FtsL